MPRCCLPNKLVKDPKGNLVNLQDALHWDWPWPMNKIPRAVNARGPRCPGKDCPECRGSGQMSWPPKVDEGFDLTRWEWCDEKGNRREVYINAFKGKKIDRSIYLIRWFIAEEIFGDSPLTQTITVDLSEGWWPSCIPTTSKKGWMKMQNGFYAAWDLRHKLFKRYFRFGWRHDFDMYFNWGPHLGRNPE